MPMQKNDLGKPWTMWVDAGGCVTIRERGDGNEGSLPVFSTEKREEAEAIRVRHCRLARDGSGAYFLNETPRSVEDLGAVSDLFRATYVGAAEEALRDPKVRRAALDILARLARD